MVRSLQHTSKKLLTFGQAGYALHETRTVSLSAKLSQYVLPGSHSVLESAFESGIWLRYTFSCDDVRISFGAVVVVSTLDLIWRSCVRWECILKSVCYINHYFYILTLRCNAVCSALLITFCSFAPPKVVYSTGGSSSPAATWFDDRLSASEVWITSKCALYRSACKSAPENPSVASAMLSRSTEDEMDTLLATARRIFQGAVNDHEGKCRCQSLHHSSQCDQAYYKTKTYLADQVAVAQSQ